MPGTKWGHRGGRIIAEQASGVGKNSQSCDCKRWFQVRHRHEEGGVGAHITDEANLVWDAWAGVVSLRIEWPTTITFPVFWNSAKTKLTSRDAPDGSSKVTFEADLISNADDNDGVNFLFGVTKLGHDDHFGGEVSTYSYDAAGGCSTHLTGPCQYWFSDDSPITVFMRRWEYYNSASDTDNDLEFSTGLNPVVLGEPPYETSDASFMTYTTTADGWGLGGLWERRDIGDVLIIQIKFPQIGMTSVFRSSPSQLARKVIELPQLPGDDGADTTYWWIAEGANDFQHSSNSFTRTIFNSLQAPGEDPISDFSSKPDDPGSQAFGLFEVF